MIRRVILVLSLKRLLSLAATWSTGMPQRYFGMIQALRRVDTNTCSVRLAMSTAMSTAELPSPTTRTRLPSYGLASR